MDDRTIVDDDSQRITNVMEAKLGDLMVLGRMVGGDFKQRAWLVVTGVHYHFGDGDKDGVCINSGNIEFSALSGADRTNYELTLVTENSLENSGLYFDCLIRPRVHHKRGIYKYKNNDFVYFDGDRSFILLIHFYRNSSPLLICPEDMDWDEMTLLYPFDEDDDNGKKNI